MQLYQGDLCFRLRVGCYNGASTMSVQVVEVETKLDLQDLRWLTIDDLQYTVVLHYTILPSCTTLTLLLYCGISENVHRKTRKSVATESPLFLNTRRLKMLQREREMGEKKKSFSLLVPSSSCRDV